MDAQPSVDAPITSVDSGLIFERDWSVFGHDFIHTLEPRAFYVYIPYRNQNSLPVFDTAQDDFHFSQLFTDHRYLGNHRLRSANPFTLPVPSRLLAPPTGPVRRPLCLDPPFSFPPPHLPRAAPPLPTPASPR